MSNVVKTKSGFTLIELMVVLSIIALLSALVFSALSKARAKARDARRTADIHEIQTALELYMDGHGGSYPKTASSTKLSDVSELGRVASSTDPLTGESYKYYGTNKNVAGENIICNNEPCTGYVLMASKEIPAVPADTHGVVVMNGSTTVATSTESNSAGSNIALVPVASISGGGGSGGGGGGGGGGGAPIPYFESGINSPGTASVYRAVEIPVGTPRVTFKTICGTGDVVLYIKQGSIASSSNYDRMSDSGYCAETISVSNPTPGTWHVTLAPYSSGSDLSNITLTVEEDAGIGATGLTGPWTQYDLPGFKDQSWTSVAYGGGLYVLVGGNYTEQPILTSADGVTWTPRTISPATGFREVVYGGGKFVAISADNKFYVSSDGIAWSSYAGLLPPHAWRRWTDITYGGGKFVATSQSGDSTSAIATSADGATWTFSTIPTLGADSQPVPADWSNITYGGGMFVAYTPASSTHQIITSPDGIAWTARDAHIDSPDTVFSGIAYDPANTRFVVTTSIDYGSQGVALVSSDGGLTWQNNPMPNVRWGEVSFGAGLFTAVHTYGNIITSPDGVTWTSRSGASQRWHVTHGGSGFVSVSEVDNSACKSADGITWSCADMIAAQQWENLSLANGKYFVNDRYGKVSYSSNGTSWSPVNSSGAGSSATGWTPIAYGNGMYVQIANSNAAGNNLSTSPDGITWTLRAMPASKTAGALIFAGGKFVAGNAGYSLTSNDGINWTVNTSAQVPGVWKGITYGAGKYVVIENGKASLSSDGVTWVEQGPLPAAGSSYWDGVAYDGARFVVSGYYNSLVTSTDGITWVLPAESGIFDDEYTRGPSCIIGACIVESTWGTGYAHVNGSTVWYPTDWSHGDPMIGTVITQLGSNAYKTLSATEGYVYISE
jgi:prepilin-type N-terminal cleavage/methylation domain-containing protein